MPKEHNLCLLIFSLFKSTVLTRLQLRICHPRGGTILQSERSYFHIAQSLPSCGEPGCYSASRKCASQSIDIDPVLAVQLRILGGVSSVFIPTTFIHTSSTYQVYNCRWNTPSKSETLLLIFDYSTNCTHSLSLIGENIFEDFPQAFSPT